MNRPCNAPSELPKECFQDEPFSATSEEEENLEQAFSFQEGGRILRAYQITGGRDKYHRKKVAMKSILARNFLSMYGIYQDEAKQRLIICFTDTGLDDSVSFEQIKDCIEKRGTAITLKTLALRENARFLFSSLPALGTIDIDEDGDFVSKRAEKKAKARAKRQEKERAKRLLQLEYGKHN